MLEKSTSGIKYKKDTVYFVINFVKKRCILYILFVCTFKRHVVDLKIDSNATK